MSKRGFAQRLIEVRFGAFGKLLEGPGIDLLAQSYVRFVTGTIKIQSDCFFLWVEIPTTERSISFVKRDFHSLVFTGYRGGLVTAVEACADGQQCPRRWVSVYRGVCIKFTKILNSV